MLGRVITQGRLDEGLWSSADPCSRFVMMIGLIVLSCSLFQVYIQENMYFHQAKELQRISETVVEVPCSSSSVSKLDSGPSCSSRDVIHLQGCDVIGFEAFSADDLGLNGFDENLPATSVQGAYFKSHVRQYSRGKSSSWKKVHENVGNLREECVYSEFARIGSFKPTHSIIARLPGSIVPLTPSLNYVQQTGWWSKVTLPYSSKNMQIYPMQVYDDDESKHFVLATSDLSAPFDQDVTLWFTVGDAKTVSVLAFCNGDHLEPWRLRLNSIADIDLTYVVKGAVPSGVMIREIGDRTFRDVQLARICGILLCWLGTWFLVFPAYVCDCTRQQHSEHFGEDLGACARALPLSLMPSFLVIGMSWAALRMPFATIAGGSFFAVSLVMMALNRSLFSACPFSASSPELVVRLPSLVQQCPPRLWPGGARPTVGSKVRIQASGLEGTILCDDHSDLPYKIGFNSSDDVPSDWFKEEQVELPNVGQAIPTEAPQNPSGPALLVEPQRLTDPLLLVGGSDAPDSGVGKWSNTMRMMFLGMALGLSVSVLCAVGLALFT